MKDLFTKLFLFIALSFVFSSFSGCPSASTQKGPVDDAKSNTTTETSKKEDSKYPLAPSAISQAEIKMLDGSTFKLEDQKGKVILFNLWATWCGPCRFEMPHLVELQEKYKDKNFEIIGLDIGDDFGGGNPESAEDITKFAKEMKLNYRLGWADGPLKNEFIRLTQMAGIPQSVLVNRDGRTTGIFTGGSMKVINTMRETVEKTVNE